MIANWIQWDNWFDNCYEKSSKVDHNEKQHTKETRDLQYSIILIKGIA